MREAHHHGGSTSTVSVPPEWGFAVAGYDRGERMLVQCAGVGVLELRRLGIATLWPLEVYVGAQCLVTVKGSALGPPKWGEHGGGHGMNTGKV